MNDAFGLRAPTSAIDSDPQETAEWVASLDSAARVARGLG